MSCTDVSSWLHRAIRRAARITILGTSLVAVAATGAAQVNGGFEDGDLGGWTAGGSAGVQVLQAAGLSPSVTPPEGSWFALLSTGPGDRAGTNSGDRDGNGVTEYDTTTLTRSFDTVSANEVMSLRWAFLTSEQTEQAAFDDIFEVRVDGATVLARSVYKPGGGSPFPDTAPCDGTARTVTAAGTTSGSSFTDGATAFELFTLVIPTAGSHTLEIAIADQNDQIVDSGVLIDDFEVTSTAAGTTQLTQTSGATLEVKGGGFEWRPQASGSWLGSPASVSADGAVVGVLSSGDLSGDNPSVQTQVFVLEDDAVERLTSTVDGEASGPSLSASGRYVAWTATDDPADTNPDHNLELFQRDRATGVTSQLSQTTSCSSRGPSQAGADSGRRIAFVTDCGNLTPGFNPDGNLEVVVWDRTFGWRTRETTGCTSRSPAISEDGTTVVFVSDCNLVGSNADHNFEIFRWLPASGAVSQLTVTTLDATGAVASSDGPTVTADGAQVAFVSSADLVAGGNPLGSLETFLWSGGSFTQLSDGSPLDLDLVARIDRSAAYVTVERLDLASFTSSIVAVDPVTLNATPLASGAVAQPVPGTAAGLAVVVYESTDDPLGLNADGNTELFRTATVLGGTTDLCRQPALAIPDNDPGGVSDDLVVTSTASLTDLDLSLVIDHTYVGDLVVSLSHVSTGTSVTVINRIRRNFNQSCGRADIDALLDDEGDRSVQTECRNNGTDPTVLSPPPFIPYEALSAFDGETLGGIWRLTVTDLAGQDIGTLQEWCLVPEVSP